MKISIIIPVYNTEKYLSRCIDSVLNQDYRDFELILVNDGSTDNSLDILKSYERKEERILLIDQKNRGVSASRNQGIDHAKGKFILFIDSDDWVEPDYLSSFLSSYQGNTKELLIADLIRMNKRKAGYGNQNFDLKTDIDEFIIYKNILNNGGPCAKFFSSEIIHQHKIRFNEKMSYGEDFVFFIHYLRHTEKVMFLDFGKYHYEYNSQSLSIKKHPFENYFYFFDELNIFRKEQRFESTQAKKAVFTLLWDVLESSLNSGILENQFKWKQNKENLKKMANELDSEFYLCATPLRKIYYFFLKTKQFSALRIFNQKILKKLVKQKSK
ncbi:MAG TPA: glycosyltransferase family A protein [Moheibacter sp.]|nr:glycosyltransferase family A protein [Moheibacter sp.]